MSNLRQGVLRAVRLLPDVVKIGVETESALSAIQGEEQLLHEAVAVEKTEAPSDPDPVEQLNEQITALRSDAAAAETAKLQLVDRVAALEAELARAKDAAVQRERELRAEVEDARERAKAEGRTQGHAEGLENGYQAGVDKARNEVETQYREKFSNLVAALEGISAKLEENFAELIALNQPRMLRLWYEMLKKMLQRETMLAPDGVLNVLAEVLSRLSDKNNVLIYVAPEDLQFLEEKMHDEFEDILRGVRHLELKSDTNVDRGSCLVETNLGVYDARWRTQLDQIESAVEKLFHKLGKAPGESGGRTRRKAEGKSEESASNTAEPAKKKTAGKTTSRRKALGPNMTVPQVSPEKVDA